MLNLAQATRSWVESGLSPDERIDATETLRGGWTSDMRRLRVSGPGGSSWLVLRTFSKPFFRKHADGLLSREAEVLRLLADTDVPAAELRAVDPTGRDCEHPSLLMTMLPGRLRLDDDGALERSELLAEMLVRIHRVPVDSHTRPRSFQAWTSPERVQIPESTPRPELWRRAVDLIRGDPPAFLGCFLHRDFHPGNVLWDGPPEQLRISGVVDWVETSWGPADLDVAHCSTALALLHGVEAGMRFADQYVAAGGTLTDDASAHLYWRLLDALAFAPNAEKVAGPWRDVGRTDLAPVVVSLRLEDYVQALVDGYG